MIQPIDKRLLHDPFVIGALLLALPVWLLIYFTPIVPLPGREFTPAQLLVLGLIFPILEELAFRGLVQGYLLRFPRLAMRQLGITGANGVTSLLFAAAHLFHQPASVAALIIFPSMIFGALRDRFGSTRPSMFMHVYYNLGLLFLLMVKSA